MFTPIEEYILLPITLRKAHLDLTELCILIGGTNSSHYRGLLAHSLRTTIPSGMKIHLCHACNDHSCSNPKHLYWGTAKENFEDTRNNGKWQDQTTRLKNKIGEEAFTELRRKAGAKGGAAPRRK